MSTDRRYGNVFRKYLQCRQARFITDHHRLARITSVFTNVERGGALLRKCRRLSHWKISAPRARICLPYLLEKWPLDPLKCHFRWYIDWDGDLIGKFNAPQARNIFRWYMILDGFHIGESNSPQAQYFVAVLDRKLAIGPRHVVWGY